MMSSKIFLLSLLAIFFSFKAFAEVHDISLASLPADDEILEAVTAQPEVLKLDGIYRFTVTEEMLPEQVILNGEIEDNFHEYLVEMSEGEPVVVEFISPDAVLLSLSLHETEQGVFPEQFVISFEEFEALQLKFETAGTLDDLLAIDLGFSDTLSASANGSHIKPRKHNIKSRFARDVNGRFVGKNGNCVAVVKYLTGFSGTAGNGKGFANALLKWRAKNYKAVSLNHRKKGTVCSWNGGWHGKGHVGWFDGHCFQPTYSNNCGEPGAKYRMKLCVAL